MSVARPFLSATVTVYCLVLAGCGSDDGRVPLAKTSGKLTWPGKPVLGLMVVFHPTDPATPKTPVQPTGVVQEDGTFSITCYELADGVPPGDYIVTLREAPRAEGSAKLEMPPAKYLKKESSPLRATIEKKPLNELPPFEIAK